MDVNEKYIKIAKEILEKGYDEEKLNKEVRPVWDDGESAYTKYLPQQVVRYEKGELPNKFKKNCLEISYKRNFVDLSR